jgi:cob(I)alamin adenosyltransferase
MTRIELQDRFNNLPREHRTTIIGNELSTEIKWLLVEKKELARVYEAQVKRINDRMKRLNKHLEELKDD